MVDAVGTCAPWAAGSAADFASTEYALSHNAVAFERNPLQRSTGARVAWAAAYSAGGCGLDVLLQRGRHQRLAKVVRIAALAIKIGLAVNNVRHSR